MPATFPSHAAAVLPLKVWRPRWFDGVALVIGSAAPDLAYPLAGVVSLPETHSAEGVLWFALPVTVVLAALVRWAAPVVAVHLPDRSALRDYGVLGAVRHPWHVVVCSALIGAVTHVVWDGFTHDPRGHGWVARRLAALQQDGLFGLPWWTVTQHTSTVVGALVALAYARHLARHRLLRAWHGDPPPAPRAPVRFWLTAAVVALVYPATWAVLPRPYTSYVQGVRILWAVGLALLAGAAVVRWSAARVGRHEARPRGRIEA